MTINKQTSTALHEACTNDPKTRVKHLSQIDGRAGKFDLKFDVSKPWKMPLLIEMFKELPEKLAFNLEVKWPVVNVKNQSENMLHQDPHWFDINEYVDDILKVVMENRTVWTFDKKIGRNLKSVLDGEFASCKKF